MAKLGVVAAARAANVSRSTINRYYKSGKLSAAPERGRHGEVLFDTSELTRVFRELRDPKEPQQQPSQEPQQQPADTSKVVSFLEQQVATLQKENERLRGELTETTNERREMQHRFMTLLERAQLTDGSSTDSTTGRSNVPSAQSAENPRHQPRRQPQPTAAETIVNGIASWLGGSSR